MKQDIKAGDLVKCIDNTHLEKELELGKIYKCYNNGIDIIILEKTENVIKPLYLNYRFKKISTFKQKIKFVKELIK